MLLTFDTDSVYLLSVVCKLGARTKRQLTAAAADDDDDDDRPIFRPAPTNITVSPGDRASLKCRVDNLGTKTVVHYALYFQPVQYS